MTIINKIKKTAKDIYNTVKEKVTSWWAKPEGKAEDVVKATYVSLSASLCPRPLSLFPSTKK